MEAVFQIAKAKKLKPKTFRPFLGKSLAIMPSAANSKGSKAKNKMGPVNGMGGQANQSKNEVLQAKRYFFLSMGIT
jgi:hypothetical protein